MSECAFCKIAREVPYWAIEHEYGVVSFKPFGPVHPKHRLFIPRAHMERADTDPGVTGQVFEQAALWAKAQGHDFNLVVNAGPHGDQTVPHLHVHYVPRFADDDLGYRWHRQLKEGA